MTEVARAQHAPSPRPAAPAPRRRPRIWPTIAAAIATFAVIFEFLAFQLSSGNDPALGDSTETNASAAQTDPRPVLQRRIVKTRVVPVDPSTPTGTTAVTPSPTTSAPASPAPVTSTPAPAPVAPAPAPVTSSS